MTNFHGRGALLVNIVKSSASAQRQQPTMLGLRGAAVA